MTAQERLELSAFRTEVLSEFKDLRTLHIDLIQRVATLEASSVAERSTEADLRSDSQFMLMKFSVALSLIVSIINFLQNH